MSAFRAFRVAGSDLRIHVSWIVILAAIVVTTADRLETADPSMAPVVRWLIGALVALGLLGSVIVHEFGHALAGRRLGIPGGPVVVHLFGAPASPLRLATRPRDDALVAVAGPLANLVVGAIAICVGLFLPTLSWSAAPLTAELALVVGGIGIALALVNLVPAYPLDGGRLVRAIAWGITGDPGRALHVAALSGRASGLVCAAIGTAIIITWSSIDGVMLALCGWFLVSHSRTLEGVLAVEGRLEGLSVADAMAAPEVRIAETLTIDTFADQVAAESIQTVAVVRGDEIVGLLDTRRLRRMDGARRKTTRAGAAMTPLAAMPVVATDTSLRVALDLFGRSGLDGLAVTSSGSVIGIVTRSGVGEAIRARQRQAAHAGDESS